MTDFKQAGSIYTVGLTGGIASGKSSVTKLFEKLGTPIVDADVIAREVVLPGTSTLLKLQSQFDQHILTNTGELDRKKLREIIFSNDSAREKVESILHPAIRERSATLVVEHAEQGAQYVICAIPLLVETGQIGSYDRIAVVDVSIETQISRIIARDNTTRKEALSILQSQATREQRLAVADDIIDNSGSWSDLDTRVLELHTNYLDYSSKHREN